MEYMKRQQTFLDDTKKKIKDRLNKNTLIGANIITYEFINEPSKTLFRGKIFFEDGEEREVRFLKSEEEIAKKIFLETSHLHNEAIVKLWFATYCEAIESWILCYDRFDSLLGDWVIKQTSQNRMRYEEDLLHFDGSDFIRSLLEGIRYVHNHGLFHKGLHLTSSYVFLSNKVKIINIGMHSLKDLPAPVDDATVNKLRMEDLMGFKALLEMHVLQPGVAWDDRDLFLSFFNLTALVRYNIFVDRLLKHSFLMKTAEERMRSFFKIVHAKELNQLPNLNEFSIILTTSETFERYLSWDAVDMGDNLKSVYEYEDENVKKRHYDGQDVMHLLEFLRNGAYRHPRRNSITKLDKDVRKAYPGFLNRLHEALCRLEHDDDD